jgi:hypothetical protein
MSTQLAAVPDSRGMLWAGRVLSTLPALLLAFAASGKLFHSPQVVEGMARSGYPAWLLMPVGIIELSCVIVYLIPRTSVLGAILMTGFLGGATASCLRVGDPSLPIPIIAGILVWAGLFFRDPRIRALIPLRGSTATD